MDIVILADFCGKMDGTGNSRFLYLAHLLCQEHQVEILTSDFDHGTKSYFERIPEGFPFKITMVHEGKYSRNVSLQRFAAHYLWSRSVRSYLKSRKKPDVLYAAIPPLTGPLEAAKYCEKNGIRFIIDIQDLWPEAYQMAFHVPVVSDLVFMPFNSIANEIYKRADAIAAVSDTYVNRALSVNRKCQKGITVFLGTELKEFDANVAEKPYQESEALNKVGILPKGKEDVWLAYCGTLGASYDLNVVFEAMRIVGDDRLKFIIMGRGEREEEFKQNSKGLNVYFTGRLPYVQMCGVLAACDIAVNPITHGAAQSIINKHGDYAAAALAVINTQECVEYRKLVDNYNMGFNCENGDAKGVAEKLCTLIRDPNLRREMGINARRCAEECFDREQTYQYLVRDITRFS